MLGSTGVVGRRALQVIDHLKEEIQIVALAARGNQLDLLEKQIQQFRPQFVVVFDPIAASALEKRVSCPVLVGLDGLFATVEAADISLFAMSGTEGIAAAIRAAQLQRILAVASKEILIVAGELLKGANILPLDSEHSSLFQCIEGEEGIAKVYLTASGGPFLHWSEEQLGQVTPEQALRHPVWSMGAKTAVDCSTLMNKGLEMIEAKCLFDLSADQIEALIHPEGVVQSLVAFQDGYIRAQAAAPDMAHSIQYALQYPQRKPGIGEKLSLDQPFCWNFFPPDRKKFRCFQLAEEVMKRGGSYIPFLNGANEVLVQRFLQGKISWSQIGEKLEQLISSHVGAAVLDLEAIFYIEKESKRLAWEA